MLPIVTPAEMAAIDAAAPEPVEVLIERAGYRVARAARQMLGGVYGRRVSVIAGPGNNGADALVASRLLAGAGVKVTVIDPAADRVPACHLVIDGAYGTGLNRDFDAPIAEGAVPVLAIDIPSGVDGLTGELHGRVLGAQRTVTFAALKPGLLLHPAAAMVGDIEVADLGLDVGSSRAWLFTGADAARLVPARSAIDHKRTRSVLVVGGSPGMGGAPQLAADAAMRAEAGYVTCGLVGGRLPGDRSEVVYRSLGAAGGGWADDALVDIERFHSLVVGPGLEPTEANRFELVRLLDRLPAELAAVIDATALRLLGHVPRLRANFVLTPHDGEFADLAGAVPGADRFASVRDLAARSGATVLLKGPLTIVAAPDGRVMASAHGDARLATAGTGDVLAGIIGSMLAAGVDPLSAAALGAWIHADAARRAPGAGMVASDLITNLAPTLSRLVSAEPRRSPIGPSGLPGPAGFVW